jgi:predicted RecA/RadA family phage recombinase
MTTTLAPQFQTQSLDLELKKGESAQFSVAVTDYNLDLRGCLIFAEIRRSVPGHKLINDFTGVAAIGSSTIQIKRYPYTDDKAQILRSLPARPGDLITLEGSGITGSKVLAVTDSQIIVSNSATRAIGEGRLLVRSLSLASFTAIPHLPNITVYGSVSTTSPATASSMAVSNVTRTIPSGTTLIFNNAIDPIVLTASLVPGSTVAYIAPISFSIASGSFAIVGATTVITTNSANIGATGISINTLSVPIPSGTLLNFGTRTVDGWQYVGSARTSAAALAGVNSLTVAALTAAIPGSAIAWFGTHAFNSFYLAIDPADTQFLESGEYTYDVVCRQSDGYTIRLIQGSCIFTDHCSDGV